MKWLVGILFLISAAPVAAFSTEGPVWDVDRGPVEFHLEPNGSVDVTDGSDLDAIRDAFRAWSCIDDTSLRFREGSAPGVKSTDLTDGLNSVFFDEIGAFGLGEATFTTTVSVPYVQGQFSVRDAADIVINGTQYQWKADGTPQDFENGVLDIGSFVIREIGIMSGLGLPCDAQDNCLPPTEAILSPNIPTAPIRDLHDDEREGIRNLYPATDESTCDGPFRQNEDCTCNDDCIDGLVCAETNSGETRCTRPCSNQNADCPVGTGCILGPEGNDGISRGVCTPGDAAGDLPVGAVCQRDNCQDGLCIATASVGRSICRLTCDNDDECPNATTCTDGVCLGDGDDSGLACADNEDEPDGCVCARGRPEGALFSGVVLFGALLLARRRS